MLFSKAFTFASFPLHKPMSALASFSSLNPFSLYNRGDSKYLESVINIRGGLKDQLESSNKEISYRVVDEVFIPKYSGNLEINFGN